MAYGVDTAVQIGGNGPTPWLYGDHLRMGGVKLYDDGALGSRGAWLKQPYADAPGQSGSGTMTDAQLQNRMSRAAMDGYQVAVHAIGDRANSQVLDAIDELSATYKGDRRWRIEHAQIVDPADLPRFGQHGVIASMQPTHARPATATMVEARLGPGVGWRAPMPGRRCSRNGAQARLRVGLSGRARPIPGPHGRRRSRERTPPASPFGGWRPEERVTREQAWWAFTGGAAYAGFADNVFGRLAVGQRADFIIVDRDPLLASASDLRATKVQETWVGGQKVWDAADESGRGKR